MKVWIVSARALRDGIVVTDAVLAPEYGDRWIRVKEMAGRFGKNVLVSPREWHESEAAASEHVRKMVKRRKAAITKELAKLDTILAELGQENQS